MISDANRERPIVVGGIGGSGTRLFGMILSNLGVWLGHRAYLNPGLDNLQSATIIERMDWRAISKESRLDILRQDFRRLGDQILRDVTITEPASAFGWKNPPMQLFLPELFAAYPEARYVHCLRNGLDMVYSSNHNQFRRWRWAVGLEDEEELPEALLDYWIRTTGAALEVIEEKGGLIVRYEDICGKPAESIKRIAEALELPAPPKKDLASLRAQIDPSDRIGQGNGESLEPFRVDQLAALAEYGYPVGIPAG